MKWNLILFCSLLILSSKSMAKDWEYQCDASPQGDCLFQREFKHDGLEFVVGFGRASGSTILVIESKGTHYIIDVTIEKMGEESFMAFSFQPLTLPNPDKFVAKVNGNAYLLENAFSAGSDYTLNLKLSNGSSKIVPASIMDIKQATSVLGENFYSKFNFPDEEYIDSFNKYLQQIVGTPLDEFIKASTVVITRHLSDKSLTMFYSYTVRKDFGREAEKIINDGFVSVVEPRMEQVCIKQLPLITKFDGVTALRVSVSLQGSIKTLSTNTMTCNYD